MPPASYPWTARDPAAGASYTYLTPDAFPPGGFARTVAVSDSVNVDLDADGRVLGVEVIGDGDWRDGLVAMAMQGRLRVTPRNADPGSPAPPPAAPAG